MIHERTTDHRLTRLIWPRMFTVYREHKVNRQLKRVMDGILWQDGHVTVNWLETHGISIFPSWKWFKDVHLHSSVKDTKYRNVVIVWLEPDRAVHDVVKRPNLKGNLSFKWPRLKAAIQAIIKPIRDVLGSS